MTVVGLLGCTGRVGGWVLEMCLERGYEVVVLVRSPDKLSDSKADTSKVTVVKGSATSADDVKAFVNTKKLDVIVSTLGSPNNDTLIMEKAAAALVQVCSSLAVPPRVVWMTSTGINEATDQAKSYPLIGSTASRWCCGYGCFGWLQFKIIIPYVIGQNLWDDMGRSEIVMRGASEDLTKRTVVVRPGNMWPVSEHPVFSQKWREEGGDNLSYDLVDANDPPTGVWIVRRAIAKALLDLVDDDSHDGKAKSLFQRK